MLMSARFVIGLGLGASSMAVPLYLAEMSPKEKRGRLVPTSPSWPGPPYVPPPATPIALPGAYQEPPPPPPV